VFFILNNRAENDKFYSLVMHPKESSMRHTKVSTTEYLKENGFPLVFINLFEGKVIPKNFDISFGIPEELYLCSESQQDGLLPSGYQPLWDDGNFDAIFCRPLESEMIVKVYVEGGEKVYSSYVHFVAHMFVFFWELEWDELFGEYAKALEFSYLDITLAFLEEYHGELPSEEIENKLNDCISNLVASNA